MIILQNDNLSCNIALKGAELKSLINKQTNLQYMWSGDAVYWGKHSPILFPIVGSLKEDTYYYEDKTYHLPRHGFARECLFTAAQISHSEAIFTLKQNRETLLAYPFAFTLSIGYRLLNNSLTCHYQVHNPGNTHLLFSIGAHPAFAVPLTGNTIYTDYYLAFNATETLQRFKLQNGLISNSTEILSTLQNRLSLHNNLFYEDAIVLKNLKSNRITIGCNKHLNGMHFNFTHFPFFGIWAAKDAPFICLEPWCGIADSVNHNQQLINKEGINVLGAGEKWEREWSVECY